MINSKEKRKLKKDAKRRIIEVCATLPFGVGFAYLFYKIGLSTVLQLFLTVVCWGAVVGIVELCSILIIKQIEKRRAQKPKRRDPFAD